MMNYFSMLLKRKMEDGQLGLVTSQKEDEDNVYYIDTGLRINGKIASLFHKDELPPFSLVVTDREITCSLGVTDYGHIVTANVEFTIKPSQFEELKIDPRILEDILIVRFESWPGLEQTEGWRQVFRGSRHERR